MSREIGNTKNRGALSAVFRITNKRATLSIALLESREIEKLGIVEP